MGCFYLLETHLPSDL